MTCHRARPSPAHPRQAPEVDIAVCSTSQELLQSDADPVERFTTALAESHAYAEGHPDETRAIATTCTNQTAELLP